MNAVLLDARRRRAGTSAIGDVGTWFIIIALASARRACSSSRRRRASSTGRASWRTWRSTRGCPTASRRCPSASACRTASCSWAARRSPRSSTRTATSAKLVVMYSINVFLTFSLSNLGMSRFWIQHRKEHDDWYRHLPMHLVGPDALPDDPRSSPCFEKFAEGGWLTLVVTGAARRRCASRSSATTRQVVGAIERLDVELSDPLRRRSTCVRGAKLSRRLDRERRPARIDPTDSPSRSSSSAATAGLGRHALLTLLRMFPGHFKGVVFCSVAVIDSGNFKGVAEVHELESRVQQALDAVRPLRQLARPPRRERVLHGHRGGRRGARSSATD